MDRLVSLEITNEDGTFIHELNNEDLLTIQWGLEQLRKNIKCYKWQYKLGGEKDIENIDKILKILS